MSLSKEHLEIYVWPRYKEPTEELAQVCWDIAKPKKGMVPPQPPAWFHEVLATQMQVILMAVFSSEQSWLVIPEPIKGFSMVVYKKPKSAFTPIPPSNAQLSLRYHTFDQFSEFSRLVEKTLVHIVRMVMEDSRGDVIELENEDGTVYVFPVKRLGEYLKSLGFSDAQIPQLLTVDDVEGFHE